MSPWRGTVSPIPCSFSKLILTLQSPDPISPPLRTSPGPSLCFSSAGFGFLGLFLNREQILAEQLNLSFLRPLRLEQSLAYSKDSETVRETEQASIHFTLTVDSDT